MAIGLDLQGGKRHCCTLLTKLQLLTVNFAPFVPLSSSLAVPRRSLTGWRTGTFCMVTAGYRLPMADPVTVRAPVHWFTCRL